MTQFCRFKYILKYDTANLTESSKNIPKITNNGFNNVVTFQFDSFWGAFVPQGSTAILKQGHGFDPQVYKGLQ